jgi:hypothetical protein
MRRGLLYEAKRLTSAFVVLGVGMILKEVKMAGGEGLLAVKSLMPGHNPHVSISDRIWHNSI